MTTPDLFAEYREPEHNTLCPARTGSLICTCGSAALARHAWANRVMRAACRAYSRGGPVAYDRVIANAKASEEL